jgi:phosphoserine phosphatase
MSVPSIDTITTLVLKKRNPEQLQAAQTALGMMGAKTLSEGLAIEGPTSHRDSHTAAQVLQSLGIEADVSVSTTKNRRKTLLICDMDSTLIGEECIDELADFAGVKGRVSAITERAMRGEIGFDGALRERVKLLKGLPLETLQTCFEQRININSGAKTLCATMKAFGAKTMIVSGGFTFFSERVAAATGFETHQANILLDDGSRLTGNVADPILGREAKLEAMLANVSDPLNAVAVGDGANDLAMVTAAGLGVAYYAKPAVAAAAQSAVRFTDLRTVLYFQGFSEDEFIEVG